MTTQTEPTIAPAGALCRYCGCSVAGEQAEVTHVYNRVVGRALPAYAHLTAGACLAAQRKSEAFWYGTQQSRP